MSDLDSASESYCKSESESDFTSVFLNLDIYIFYVCIPVNKPADIFLSILLTESIVMKAIQA